MIGGLRFRSFASSSVRKSVDLPVALAFLVFAVLEVYAVFIILTSETLFGVPNIFINSGIPAQRREVEFLGHRFEQLYILISLQYIPVCVLSWKGGRRVNLLLLVVNVFNRLLCAIHLPVYLSDVYRNELYGELAARGYNPYSTYLSEEIPFVKEYEAAGLPSIQNLWPEFTYSYPTTTGAYFLLLCSVFPGFGYWQEVLLLTVTSMLDIFAGLLVSRISQDSRYRYAVLYTFFPPALNMASNGQIEALPNSLILLSYYYLTREHFYRSFLADAVAFQSKFYPLAWLPVILHKSRRRARGLLCFAAVASLMSIPFLASPDYFTFFEEKITVQPYSLRISGWVFVAAGLFLTFKRRNIIYTTISTVYAALSLSSFVPLWYHLWINPTIFILMKEDKRTTTALMLYLYIATYLYL